MHPTQPRRSTLVRSLAIFALLLLPHLGSHAQSSRVDSLDEIGTGMLIRQTAQGLEALPSLDLQFEITVDGVLATGTLTQVFANTSQDTFDATYHFPLPDRAVVHGLEMRIGDRVIRGEIHEKQEARQQFERAQQMGQRAALVEAQRSDLFKTQAANISPGDRIEVRLEFVQPIDVTDERYSLRLPLTFIARPTAPTPGTPTPASKAGTMLSKIPSLIPSTPHAVVTDLPTASVAVRLRSGFEVNQLSSPSHPAIEIQSLSTNEFQLVHADASLGQDFRLEWRPASRAHVAPSAFASREGDEEFVSVLLVPPSKESDRGMGLATDTMFVIDVSGSMQGPSIKQARRALRHAVDRLRPEDRFNIVWFNDDYGFYKTQFIHADDLARADAQAWISQLGAGGGTAIEPALVESIAAFDRERLDRPSRIVFLTDGAVANEEQVLQRVAAARGRLRIHAIAIGAAPNASFIRRLASQGHGLHGFVSDLTHLADGLDRFLESVDRPVWTDLELDWNGVTPLEVFPAEIPDLHAGQPLLITARVEPLTGPARVRLSGWTRLGSESLEAEIPARAASGRGLSLHWARAKVEHLLDERLAGASEERTRARVLDVALKYGLVTPYTSLVAIEQTPSATEPALSARVPNALAIGGTSDELLRYAGYVLILLGLFCMLCFRAVLRGV